MYRLIISILLLFFSSVTIAQQHLSKVAASAKLTGLDQHQRVYTFVIVHGSTGGGWDWKGIDIILSARKHEVYRPTLTGLGEKVHLANPEINLSTHIDDIVNLIRFEDLQDIVLVGHSYAGMVITGVMNKIPQRIHHAIFLDAFVPAHGMTAFQTWKPAPPAYTLEDGQVYFPWVDKQLKTPGDRPQSLKTFTEAVAFDNPAAKKIATTYIAFVAPEQEQQRKLWDESWQRAQKRGWQILTLNSDHNAQRSHPQELSRLLQQAPGNKI